MNSQRQKGHFVPFESLQHWLADMDGVTLAVRLAALPIAIAVHRLLPARQKGAARANPSPALASPERMTPEDQWARLFAVVETALDRSHRIGDLHTYAERQLDSMDYALHCLVQDMQRIMPVRLPNPLDRPAVPAPARPVAEIALAA